MSEPYIYTDPDGAKLSIARSATWPNLIFIRPSSDGAYIAPADLPTIVAELYRAAGKPAPILLDRPAEEDLRAGGWLDGNQVSATERTIGTITPGLARAYAARLAGAADLADAEPDPEPDPEQVKQLADLLMEQAGWHRHPAELAAKAVLRAGFTRSES